MSENANNASTIVDCSGTTWPESAHNYAYNTDITWVYTDGEASGYKITFSSFTNTKSEHDYIYIYDGDDIQIGKYSGTELVDKTIEITGDTFKIRLTSDGSNDYYGFELIQAITTAVSTGEDGLKYIKGDSSVTITCYDGEQEILEIPSTIEELPVTSIASSAFVGCSFLKGVNIPQSVTKIGCLAFSGCTGLTSITVPNSVAQYI